MLIRAHSFIIGRTFISLSAANWLVCIETTFSNDNDISHVFLYFNLYFVRKHPEAGLLPLSHRTSTFFSPTSLLAPVAKTFT